jgi:hypothetical protein
MERRQWMAYTPELSQDYSGALRRIAWALGLPMTTALEEVIFQVGREVDHKFICKECRDNSFCDRCLFNEEERIM